MSLLLSTTAKEGGWACVELASDRKGWKRLAQLKDGDDRDDDDGDNDDDNDDDDSQWSI